MEKTQHNNYTKKMETHNIKPTNITQKVEMSVIYEKMEIFTTSSPIE